MNLRLEWRCSLKDEDFPAAAYEQLCDASPQATPFNRLAWLRGAEQVLSKRQRLQVLLGWDQQELVLCLPLIHCRERKAGWPVQVVRHLGFPLSDRFALLVSPKAEQSMPCVLREIRKQLPHALLQLSELVSVAPLLQDWKTASSYSDTRISCRAPELLLNPAGYGVTADKSLAYKLRRATKRCVDIGAQIKRISPNVSDIDAVLDAIIQVEQASWKGEEGLGIFSGDDRKHWMRTALRGLAEQDRVRVVLMEHEGRCISYRLGLFDKGRLYDYNLAYLPEYSNLSSGRLLLDEWIRWGLDAGWTYIDASRVSLHDSTHQLHERMSGLVEHERWSFYSWRPTGLALGLADRLWQMAKPRLKQWRDYRAERFKEEQQA